MPKRRTYLVDRKFQLGTTFRVIGFIIIVFMIIIAVTGIISTDNNRKIAGTINDLNRSIAREKKTIEALMEAAGMRRNGNLTGNRHHIIDEHMETTALMLDNVRSLRTIMNQNLVIITVMVVTGVLAGIVLFLYLIRLTNRIAGPIYVLGRHMDDVLKGNKPNLRALRRDDELKEFYRQFVEFIEKTRRR